MNSLKFFRQGGWLPTLTSTMGLLICAYIVLGTLTFLIPEIINIYTTEPFLKASSTSIKILGMMMFVVFPFLLIFAGLLLSVFPEVRVTDKGLEYRVLILFRSCILWSEIKGVKDLKRGYKALLILRPGFILINGLYVNKIYAQYIRSEAPVLFLSPKLENLGTILSLVEKYSSKNPIVSI